MATPNSFQTSSLIEIVNSHDYQLVNPSSALSGFQYADLLSFLNDIESRQWDYGLSVKGRKFGAIGDGQSHQLSTKYVTLTDAQAFYPAATSLTQEIDECAIQKAINFVGSIGGGKVVIPDSGKFMINEVQINQPFITVSGRGSIYGRIVVGGGLNIPTDLHFKIENITVIRQSLQSGNHGIELQNARIGEISGVTFRNLDKSIYVRPINGVYFQQCTKVDIHHNKFKNVNYCFYVDRPSSPTQLYQVGDFTFDKNYAFDDVLICHVYCLGIDGLRCTGNTFFFPGYAAQNQTKTNHIYIDFGNFISIVDNQLFEAGYESIILSRCRNFTISNNRIPWAGQRAMSAAIRIMGGDQNGDIFNVGSIGPNQIEFPTLDGISIEGNCGYITVGAGNTVRHAGDSYAYYGTELLTSRNHYGVRTEVTCQFVYVIGNNMPDNDNNILGANNIGYDNLTIGRTFKQTNYTLPLNGIETTVAVGKYDGIDLTQSAPTTITDLTGGFEGKILRLYAMNGNTTLQYGTGTSQFIGLKGAVNATIPINGTITLQFRNSKWVELGRSF